MYFFVFVFEHFFLAPQDILGLSYIFPALDLESVFCLRTPGTLVTLIATLLTSDNSLFWEAVLCILDQHPWPLCLLDANSNPPSPVVKISNVSRYCQMSPRGQNGPQLRSTGIAIYLLKIIMIQWRTVGALQKKPLSLFADVE